MFSITESALDPEYCKYLWEEYKTADDSHPDWSSRYRPRFNTHRDIEEELEEEWIEMFQIPISSFISDSGYKLQEQFPIKDRTTRIFINRYPIGSYLKWHTDEIGHKVCIIYLNPEWNGEKQGGVLEHLNEYWDKHKYKQRRILQDSEFYKPTDAKEIYKIEPIFNRAVYLNRSDKAILHRTTPILGTEPKLSLRIAVTETVYGHGYTKEYR